jgi:MFS family permease
MLFYKFELKRIFTKTQNKMTENILKSQKLLPLFITQFFGAFNDNVFKNALLIYYKFSLSDIGQIDSKIFVSLAAGLFILPFFLFSSLAGQIADKYEKSSLIVKIKFAEIILMILGALAFWFQNVNLLLLILL